MALAREADGRCLVLPVFIDVDSGAQYPDVPHFLSGTSIKVTLDEIFKLKGVTLSVGKAADIAAVVSAVAVLIEKRARDSNLRSANVLMKRIAEKPWTRIKAVADQRQIVETGTSSTLYCGTLAGPEGAVVAVKELALFRGASAAEAARAARLFRHAAEVALTLRHPNVLPMLDLHERGGKYFLLMPYASRGDLQLALFPPRGRPVLAALADFRFRLRLLRGVALGLKYLHGHAGGKLRRDIKVSVVAT